MVGLCLSAFGPYLIGSMRTEQLAVYAMAPLVLLSIRRLPGWSCGHLIAWSWVVLMATVGALFPYDGPKPWEPGSTLAGYDNLLLPLMLMLAVWCLVPANGALPVLRATAWAVSLAAAGNAILAAISTVKSLDGFLRQFWSNQDVLETVAERAQTMGRYAGVFGQPAEAGLVYSIAAVLAVWRFGERPARMYLLLSLFAIGGVLSVSKVFLLVGLPVTLILLWISNARGAERTMLIVVLLSVAPLVSTASFFQEWTGFDFFIRLLDPPEGVSLIEFYTSGRWNSDTHMSDVLSFVLLATPWVGVGVDGLKTAYDAQWTETLVLSGVLGTLGVVATMILLFVRVCKLNDRGVRLMGFAFLAVLFGASFGITSLTANRAATVVWIVAALLVAISHSPAKVSEPSPLPRRSSRQLSQPSAPSPSVRTEDPEGS